MKNFVIIRSWVDEERAPVHVVGTAESEREAREKAVKYIEDREMEVEESYGMSYIFGEKGPDREYVWIEKI